MPTAYNALLRFSTAAALAYAAYAMCRAPLLPLFARHLGAGPEMVGLVAGASTLTGVLLKLPAGAISDAAGRRVVLVVAGGVFALTPLFYPWIPTLTALIVLRLVHGSATALFGPTASATLSDLAPANERGRWLGTYAAIQGAGQTAGPVVGGLLLQRYGFNTTFVTAAVLGSVAWAMMFAQRDSGAAHDRVPWREIRTSIGQVLRDRRLIATSLAQAGQFMLHGMIAAFLPLYAVEAVRASASEAGFLFGAQMLTTILSRPLFGRVSDRVGRRPMIVAGLTTCALAVAALPALDTFAALLACSALYGAGLAVTTTSTGALITDLSRRSQYGAAHGLFGTIFDIGDALGPVAGGIVLARYGYTALFHGSAALAIVVAVVFAVTSRRWRL